MDAKFNKTTLYSIIPLLVSLMGVVTYLTSSYQSTVREIQYSVSSFTDSLDKVTLNTNNLADAIGEFYANEKYISLKHLKEYSYHFDNHLLYRKNINEKERSYAVGGVLINPVAKKDVDVLSILFSIDSIYKYFRDNVTINVGVKYFIDKNENVIYFFDGNPFADNEFRRINSGAYTDLSKGYLYNKLVARQDYAFSDIYIDQITHKPVITMATPIYNSISYNINEILGVLYTDINQDDLVFLYKEDVKTSWENSVYSYLKRKDNEMHMLLLGSVENKKYFLMEEDVGQGYTVVVYANPIKLICSGLRFVQYLVMTAFLIIGALSSIVLYKGLRYREREANIDKLTGAFTRRALPSIEKNVSNAVIVYLDCNNFKSINDTYGHAAGDEALVFIAKTIKDNIRTCDYIIRLGGDEFIVILKTYDMHIADNVIQRILMKIKMFSADFELTLSYGMCEYHLGCDFKHVIHMADKLQYKNKIDSIKNKPE